MENDNIVLLIKEAIRDEFENQRPVTPDIQLISETEVGELLKVSKVTLNKWRRDNILIEGKHYLRLGGCLRYKKNALLNFSK
jgi:hypothetical protein